MMKNEIIVIVTIFVIGVVVGLGLGYSFYLYDIVKETNTHQKNQKDGSIVIQKVIDTVLQEKLVKVKDTKIVKEIEIKVVPSVTDTIVDTLTVGDTVYITKTLNCDTVSVTMHILRNKDNTLSVQAKSRGGEIISSIDIPRENVEIQKKLKNSVGIDYTIKPKEVEQSVGAFYNRDVGPFVVGTKLGVNIKDPSDISVGFGLGMKF